MPEAAAPATPATGGTATPAAPKRRASRSEYVDRMIRRHGSADRALEAMADDNWRHREGRRKAEEEVARLTALVPKDGTAVLSKEEAEAFAAFKALNIKPADLKTRLDAGDAAIAKVTEFESTTLLAEAAGIAGWNKKAAAKILKDNKITVEVRTIPVEKDGKTEQRKVVYGKTAAADAKFEPLTELVKREIPEYLPALLAKEETPAGGSGASSTDSDAAGIVYPGQGGAGDTAHPKDAISAHVAGTYGDMKDVFGGADKK